MHVLLPQRVHRHQLGSSTPEPRSTRTRHLATRRRTARTANGRASVQTPTMTHTVALPRRGQRQSLTQWCLHRSFLRSSSGTCCHSCARRTSQEAPHECAAHSDRQAGIGIFTEGILSCSQYYRDVTSLYRELLPCLAVRWQLTPLSHACARQQMTQACGGACLSRAGPANRVLTPASCPGRCLLTLELEL